ncbi:MAG TPA: glutathione S-transferase family protein [Kofleriaceae bacterium]|nr:glutathione S-transferase family protein [Kofleriaceae bacterium]
MLRIYGSLPSRVFRCLWMLEECGVAYEHVRIPFADVSGPAYRALNPNARVPTLIDGDLVLWESLAINLYLAQRYGGSLWPAGEPARAHTLQWTMFAVAEIEPHTETLLRNRVLLPPSERSAEAAARAERELVRPLGILDGFLADHRFLTGPAFAAADLNLASVLSSALLSGMPLDRFAEVAGWLQACLKRPYPYPFFSRRLT